MLMHHSQPNPVTFKSLNTTYIKTLITPNNFVIIILIINFRDQHNACSGFTVQSTAFWSSSSLLPFGVQSRAALGNLVSGIRCTLFFHLVRYLCTLSNKMKIFNSFLTFSLRILSMPMYLIFEAYEQLFFYKVRVKPYLNGMLIFVLCICITQKIALLTYVISHSYVY